MEMTMDRPATGIARPLPLQHASGSRAEAYAHGAQAISFVHPEFGEALFMSRHSRFGEGVAMRGGIPVVFPQFSADGPLPRHGFVRTAEWQVAEQGDGRIVFRLQDDDATRALWPYEWTAEVAVSLADDLALRTDFSVTNRGRFGFAFTCALHTYLRLHDVRRSALLGLGGVSFRDRVTGGEKSEREDILRVRGPVDRIYLNAPDRVSVRDGAGRRMLILEKEGFQDLVVWNPWAVAARALTDLEDEEYRDFICVEPANVGKPIFLDGGESWAGSQVIRLEAAPATP
jgi:glucose-6-phosphate 1-epimerase